MAVDTEFWETQLEQAKTAAAGYLTAIIALSTTNVQSFTLDTGQNRQTVVKKDLASLQRSYTSMLNVVATLEARICGAAGQGRPGW
ncbi:MAG: hypothetical protein ACYTFK_14760 [Planctomycetota bacterium]|jgi:hypothetical protein